MNKVAEVMFIYGLSKMHHLSAYGYEGLAAIQLDKIRLLYKTICHFIHVNLETVDGLMLSR